MLFVPKNREDIFRYFKGTYVKFKEYGDELFYIDNVDQMKITGQHESGSPFILYLDDDTPYDCEYILPHKSFFQFGSHALQLARIPAKQYHRGLCNANTALLWLAEEGRVKQWALGFDVLKAYVNKKKFFTMAEAALDGSNRTMALSPRMMYCRTNRSIYIDFTVIARIQPTKKKICILRSIFQDEVKDLLTSNGEHTEWEIVFPADPKKEVEPVDEVKKSQQDLLKSLKAKHGKYTPKAMDVEGVIPPPIVMDDIFVQGDNV